MSEALEFKDKNGENASHLEVTELLLVHCNIGNNDYQSDSGVLYILFSNKLFARLSDILTKNIIFFKKLYFTVFIYWGMFYRSIF